MKREDGGLIFAQAVRAALPEVAQQARAQAVLAYVQAAAELRRPGTGIRNSDLAARCISAARKLVPRRR